MSKFLSALFVLLSVSILAVNDAAAGMPEAPAERAPDGRFQDHRIEEADDPELSYVPDEEPVLRHRATGTRTTPNEPVLEALEPRPTPAPRVQKNTLGGMKPVRRRR